jgi:hypothetical protein
MKSVDELIDRLADEARPVRARSSRLASLGFSTVAALTVLASAVLLGLRTDVRALSPSPVIVVAAGLMLLVAASGGFAAIRSARPQVGAPASGSRWALAALFVLPVAAFVGIAADPSRAAGLAPAAGIACLLLGVAAGFATLLFLFAWQRGGAPVNPNAAAWLSGLAAGAVGALAVTVECPVNGLAHLCVWHVAAVPLSGLAARLVLPRFLRW